MTEKQYLIVRADYDLGDGTVTFTKIDSDLDADIDERVYEMVQDAASKMARNLRRGLELKIVIDDEK